MNQLTLTRRLRQAVITLLLTGAMASFTASAQSQIVSIDAKNVTVKELLQQLEARSNYSFAYSDNDIPVDHRVTIKANNKTVRAILQEALPGVALDVKGNKIVLLPGKTASKATAQAPGTAGGDKGRTRNETAMRTISGRVLDETGEPMIGASVSLKNNPAIGVATDIDGNFTLSIPAGAADLNVSYIGYAPVTSRVTASQNSLTIKLDKQLNTLDDVVVVGYGVQNKRDVTTAITSIKAEDFKKSSSADFREAMAAKMPGVQVVQLGGDPSGNVSVRVRGIQSATSGNDPLYVIDGVICDQRAFANLESADIESLEVLKDASAAAIYGSRGSCGVIIVTTKRGSSEKPVVTYDGSVGFSEVAHKIDMLGAHDFATLFAEARNGAYLAESAGASIDDDMAMRPQTYHRINPIINQYIMDSTGTLPETDWQDEIFRKAISTKHYLSVSGKTPTLSYYAGLNYLYREGTIIGSDFKRYGARINLDGKIGKRVSYGINFSPTYSDTHAVASDAQYNSNGVVTTALMCAPIFPVYNPDGSYNWDMNGKLRTDPWDTQLNEVLNPVALAKEVEDRREKVNVLGNAYVQYEFLKGLTYRLTLGTDFYSYNRHYYRPSTIPSRGYRYGDAPSQPQAIDQKNNYYHWSITNQINFNRTFGDHRINAVAVYEAEHQTTSTSQIQGLGVIGDDKIHTTKGMTIDPDNTYDNRTDYTFQSWLVRAQYTFKDRYMLSASIRGDGSSRFAKNTRWGYFPAASVGWRMNQEEFLREITWLDELKLRASVGQTGNAQIGNYDHLALYSSSQIDMGNGVVTQYYPQKIANDDLGWEKNTQYNVGVDFNLFQGYFGMNIDLYHSKTTNMLFDVPVSSVSGQTSSQVNIGSMLNRGIELQLTSRHSYGDFSYAFNANWSLNRNEVKALGNQNADIIKESSYSGAYYLTRVGQPVGCYYLMVQDGIFHNREELNSYPHFPVTRVGDFRFVDVNGDGVIDQDADRAIVGNYMPDFYYGFGANLAWRGIDLSFNFQGVYGNEILNLERRYLLNMEASSNMMAEALQRFPYGNLNRATRKSTGRNGASTSTFHIEDGSYLRLQNLSIGYTLPKKWLSAIHINSLRFYLQGNNLFTWTNYTGYNPEASKHSSDALRPGEDYGSYPVSRTFTFGLNVTL